MKVDNSFSWFPKKLVGLGSLNVTIVGGTGGLGRAITAVFAGAGANVTVIGQTFRDSDKENVKFIKADLSSIASSQDVAKKLDVSKTDILLFTTGIFAAPTRQETKEGLERDIAVSYLNRLAMIRILAPKLGSEKNSLGFSPRIFIMAYPGSDQLGTPDDLNSEKKYGTMQAHMNTVAGNEALVYDSALKYKNLGIYGLNPGLVKTNIRDNLFGENSWKSRIIESVIGWFTNTPEQYATKISPLLIAEELNSKTGGIFNNSGKALFPSKGFTNEYASQYIKRSEELLKSKNLI